MRGTMSCKNRGSLGFVAVVWICLASSPVRGQDMSLYRELFNFPLRENPFFVKIVTAGGMFSGEGIEDKTKEDAEYICNTFGNLDCGDTPISCRGLGMIDCTTDCPGTEEEFKHFMSVMEDPNFAKNYPELQKMKDKQASKEKKENSGKPATDPKKSFFALLSNCHSFSEDTMALIKLASGGGPSFGSGAESAIQKVDEGSVSGFGSYEYDYDLGEDASETTEEPAKPKVTEIEIEDDLYGGQFSTDADDAEPVTKKSAISKTKENQDKAKEKIRSKPLNNNIGTKSRKGKEILQRPILEKVESVSPGPTGSQPTSPPPPQKNKQMESKVYHLKSAEDIKAYEKEKRLKGKSFNKIRSAVGEEGSINLSTTPEKGPETTTLSTSSDSGRKSRNSSTAMSTGSTTNADEDKVRVPRKYSSKRPKISGDGEGVTATTSGMASSADSSDTTSDASSDIIKRKKRGTAEQTERRVKRNYRTDDMEVEDLLMAAVEIAKDIDALGKKSVGQKERIPTTLERLADEVRRFRREIGIEPKKTGNRTSVNSCIVKNMTCSRFPSKLNCTGIGVGHCGSHGDLLAIILTPQVVVISLFAVMAFAALVLTMTYYMYKRKSASRISPSDPAAEDSKTGNQNPTEE